MNLKTTDKTIAKLAGFVDAAQNDPRVKGNPAFNAVISVHAREALPDLLSDLATVKVERDAFRDEVERREAEYRYLRARYDEAKAERDALQARLDALRPIEMKLDGFRSDVNPKVERAALQAQLDELRTRYNDLAAINGQLESRLEAVRQWTPEREQAVADALEIWRNSGGFACSYPEDNGVLDCMMTLAQAYDDLHPLPEGERVGRPAAGEMREGGDWV